MQNEFAPHPRLTTPEPTIFDVLSAGVIRVWKHVATMERLLRNDKPRGVMPNPLSVRPKGRGLVPRHELWID